MTLLEVLVSLGVLSMISLLIYGAFDSMSRGKRGEAIRAEKARSARDALARMQRELSSAYVSVHQPLNQAIWARRTAFVGRNSTPFDRVDFTTFAHRRIERDSKESDQAEVGYFVVDDPNVDGKKDLVRREQAPIDLEPGRGGVVNVLVEDVETFDVRYLDPITGQWVDTWDTTQATGQFNRIPMEIRIILVVKGVGDGPEYRYVTKFTLPITQVLNFGVPR